MNIEELREYCLSKPSVTEGFPFDEVTLVFKVGGKMFLLTTLNEAFRINLKNTPDKVIELQEEYSSVYPGYHMNKRHWITVSIDGSIPDTTICRWIDESYNLIVSSLSKKIKDELNLK